MHGGEFYCDSILRLDEQLNEDNWFHIKDFAGYCAQLLPAVLSRFCCRASDESLNKIVTLCLKIYNSKKRRCYREVRQLIERLMASISHEKKISLISTFLKFPNVSKEDNLYNQFIDPLLELKIKQDKNNYFADKEVDEINELLNNTEGENSEFELGRLIVLSNKGVLTKKQHLELINILEEYKYNLPDDFFSTTLLCIDIPSNLIGKAHLKIKESINNKLDAIISYEGLSMGHGLFTEYVNSSANGVFDSNDIDGLISKSYTIIEKLISYIVNKCDMFGSKDFAISQVREVFIALFHLIAKNPNWTPSPTTSNLMDEIVGYLDDHNLYFPFIKIMWNNKKGINISQSFLVNDLISTDECKQARILDTLNLSFCYENSIIDSNIIKECLELLLQKIMWHYQEGLGHAINTINRALTVKAVILTEGMIKNLRYGLGKLYIETKINGQDTIDIANYKGEVRIAALKLADALGKKYFEQGLEMPGEILTWKSVVDNM